MKLSDKIAKRFQPIKLNCTHIVDEGGRASTKSSKNALLILFLMLQYPDCETIVVRQHNEHHRNSTLKELIIAADRLGLVESVHYKYSVSPLQITLLHNGSSIYFGSVHDYNKLKGTKPSNEKKYFGIIWFFECTEFTSATHIEQAVSTFARGKKPIFHAIYETNPPEDEYSWWNTWKEKVKKNDMYNFTFSTYLDLTDQEKKEWLGKFLLEQIEMLKKVDVEQYNHIYLGMPRVLTDAIYKNKPTLKEKPDKFDYILCGLDYGEADATTCVFVGVLGEEYYIFDQYYHKGEKSGKKTIIEYKTAISKYVNDVYEKEQTGMYMYIETQPMTVFSLFTSDKEINPKIDIKKVDKGKVSAKSANAIQERIDVTNILINSGKLFITDEKLQINKAFSQAVYKKGKRCDDGTSDIDSLDAFEYAIKIEFKHILKNIGLGD